MLPHMRTKLITAIAVGAAFLIVPPQQARASLDWTDSRSYISGDLGPVAAMSGQCGIGHVCFGRVSADSVLLEIRDDVNFRVGGLAEVRAGGELSTHRFCGGKRIELPPRGADLVVIIDGPANDFGLSSPAGYGCDVGWLDTGRLLLHDGTTGIVRATFTSR